MKKIETNLGKNWYTLDKILIIVTTFWHRESM